ncbi:hypothetical protein [Methylobacterium sp. WL19]|uniref:hypothetical protein n=1 Tax=Methylobacterium sp. WL19 TaxID=2603896 RepID=UPI0011C75EF5|nr:hypothetical protein [Methylobacterium sp. WL19]TXN25659.1 hypothetical protein FV220_17830 [Methylobacterium sp. WL19]
MKILATLALALSIAMVGAARGQAVTSWVDDPLPEALKGRAAELVRVLRPNDAEAALANMKMLRGGFGRNAELHILRLEADCNADYCMTLIARINDQAITPELTFIAGKTVLFSDWSEPRWGTTDWWPIIGFQGTKDAALIVTRRGEQWVITACGQCQSWVHEKPAKPPDGESALRTPPPYPETYDDFRRALEFKP